MSRRQTCDQRLKAHRRRNHLMIWNGTAMLALVALLAGESNSSIEDPTARWLTAVSLILVMAAGVTLIGARMFYESAAHKVEDALETGEMTRATLLDPAMYPWPRHADRLYAVSIVFMFLGAIALCATVVAIAMGR